MTRIHITIVVLPVLAWLAGSPAAAQEKPVPGWARVSFLTNVSVNTPADGGGSSTMTEVITTAAVQSPTYEGAGTEYGLDMRFAGYPSSEDRASRVSIYDGYVARRFASGRLGVKFGQMWLNELGALGSVGGALVEARQAKHADGARLRAGLFTGWEPQILEAGYVNGVRKIGGYFAYDGAGAHRDVVAFVSVRNQNLTERSVLLTNNFLPLGKRVFVYQSAEYDLVGPAGNGSGGLTYFFTNARVSATDKLDLQGTYHRGRSIDVRSISNDQLSGRPIDPRALEGLLFESVGGRVTATVATGVRVFGGYARDRNNRDDVPTGRVTFGASAANIGSTGLDLSVSDSRILRSAGSTYDSWYVSIGRTAGTRLYVTGDYSSSLSVLRLGNSTGVQIETRPRTQRFGGSGIFNLSRAASLHLTVEHTQDPSFSENRVLAGLTYRF